MDSAAILTERSTINKDYGGYKLDIKKYGFDADMIKDAANGATPARVVAVHRERYDVVCEYGETSAVLKTKEYYMGFEEFPTTGDFVLIDYNPSGASRVVKTLPRKTYFSRSDAFSARGEQAVAANFDYVFIMQSMNHDFNEKRMVRYMTLAWQSGATPVVVLTKSDLADDPDAYIAKAEATARGIEVYPVSAKTGEGIAALGKYFAPGKTSVFLGSSGIGKSTLVNALAGEEIMTTNGIREDDSKGRHTTTYRQLVMLKSGAMIIDTPGMRELGMWDVSTGLGEAFDDVEQFLRKCKFSDCRHETEPGCAVKAAIADGLLSPERWANYLELKSEARFTDAEGKEAYIRSKEQRFKEIAKWSRKMKNERKNNKYRG